MEKINIHNQEKELICQLLDVVNSKEEFLNLMAEKTRLFSCLLLMKGGARKW